MASVVFFLLFFILNLYILYEMENFSIASVVRGLFLVWVNWIADPTCRELHFKIGIVPGTIPS